MADKKRLNAPLPRDLYLEAKIAALRSGVTLTEFLTEAITTALSRQGETARHAPRLSRQI